MLLRLWQKPDHALVNQPGFFLARNDADRKAKNFLRGNQKCFAVAGFTQCLRGNGADLLGFKTGKPLTKARQALPAALHGLGRQHAARVKAIALADRFLHIVDAVDAAVVDAANFKTEAVGAQVHSGDAHSVLHR